jgi:uncharacterized protein
MKKQIMLQVILMAIFFLVGCTLASAKPYHITLLTVGEIGEETIGGTADAYLEVKHGTGRIFLDSFPLTKLDTQISTRYANQVACDYLSVDCSHYDFFYTIRADSTIVGGPSASASLTILTIAALKGLKLRNDTVMTGTINSGGSIGPVGGIVKKAMAAEKVGFKRVLVPLFSFNIEEAVNETIDNNTTTKNTTNKTNSGIISINNKNANQTNITADINKTKKELSLEEANLSIEVIKVSNIEEALAYFTDTPIKQADGNIKVPAEYTGIMQSISESLCNRAMELNKRVKLAKEDDINKSKELIFNINRTFEKQDYYSAASYCFTLGVLLRKANLKDVNEKNPFDINRLYNATKKAVEEFDHNLKDINLTTLSELETYVIVKERLLEAEESLAETANNISTDSLAYAIERYYSGVYWSHFFKMQGEKMELNKEYLKTACYKKLSEAEERINYAGLYIPVELQSAKDSINQAYAFAVKEDYKMCLYKASFAKAESNVLLSSLSIGKEHVEELAQEKLKAAKKVIAKEQSRGIFPIMGYSYYEYANSLKENNDVFSSLIFSEYALELSNIEIYFPRKEFKLPFIDYNLVLLLSSGLALGIAVGIILGVRASKSKKGKKRKAKKQVKAKIGKK